MSGQIFEGLWEQLVLHERLLHTSGRTRYAPTGRMAICSVACETSRQKVLDEKSVCVRERASGYCRSGQTESKCVVRW